MGAPNIVAATTPEGFAVQHNVQNALGNLGLNFDATQAVTHAGLSPALAINAANVVSLGIIGGGILLTARAVWNLFNGKGALTGKEGKIV